MCSFCSVVGVPVCSSGIVCSANFHEILSFVTLAGSGLIGSVFGLLRNNKEKDVKKK